MAPPSRLADTCAVPDADTCPKKTDPDYSTRTAAGPILSADCFLSGGQRDGRRRFQRPGNENRNITKERCITPWLKAEVAVWGGGRGGAE